MRKVFLHILMIGQFVDGQCGISKNSMSVGGQCTNSHELFSGKWAFNQVDIFWSSNNNQLPIAIISLDR